MAWKFGIGTLTEDFRTVLRMGYAGRTVSPTSAVADSPLAARGTKDTARLL